MKQSEDSLHAQNYAFYILAIRCLVMKQIYNNRLRNERCTFKVLIFHIMTAVISSQIKL